jgi:hypothetical protein
MKKLVNVTNTQRNAKQTIMRYLLTSVRTAANKSRKGKCWGDVGTRGNCTVGGECKLIRSVLKKGRASSQC